MRNTYKKYNKSKKNLTRKLLGGARKQIRHKKHKSGENFEKLNLSLQVAKLFVETNKSFEEISTFLQNKLGTDSYTEFRQKLAGSDTDAECKNAAKVATSPGSTECKCTGFINSSERNRINEQNYDDVDGRVKWLEQVDETDDRPFNTLGVKIGILNSETKKYEYSGSAAGPCWLCNEPVYFYFDGEDKTGCGECEHVGSIMPSLFAGMLKKQNLSAFIYNYGLSHVHCNQRKSNMVSMIFNHATLKWQHDQGGTSKIVNTILKGNKVHASEYCPYFKDEFSKWKGKARHIKQSEMITKIKNHTVLWANKANDQLTEIGNSRDKIKNATKLVQAIQFMVEKSIKNSDPSNSSSGGTRWGHVPRQAPDGIYNYDGLNINIDTKEQIKEEDIKAILEYIRHCDNKTVFKTLVDMLKESVNETNSYLSLDTDGMQEMLTNTSMLEAEVAAEVAAEVVAAEVAAQAAAEVAAEESAEVAAEAVAAAVRTPVKNNESARAAAAYKTPNNSQSQSQSHTMTQSRDNIVDEEGEDDEDDEVSRISEVRNALFPDLEQQRPSTVIPGEQLGVHNMIDNQRAKSVPLPVKKTSLRHEREQGTKSPKIFDHSSPQSSLNSRGGKRKRRTRKKKRE
jgi:hypothetical protein